MKPNGIRIFDSIPELTLKARELRKKQTPAEELLWQLIRNRQLNHLKFRRQHPAHGFILDFYCAEKMVGIEVDGGYHNSPEQQERDFLRTMKLESHGIRLIRFSNEQVLNNTEETLNKISEFCEDASPPAPLH